MTAKDNSIQSSLLDGMIVNQQIHRIPMNIQQQQLPPDYTSSTIQENEPSDDEDDDDEQSSTQLMIIIFMMKMVKLIFPLNDLIKLEEQLNQARWVVPVLPDGELIKCLRAAVRLAAQSNI